MTTGKKGFLQTLWDFFCSLKLAISLLISLAITSIIGTVIPQGNIPPEYLQTISETKLRVYQSLGFFDMYHSWWYILLLYLFTVNLIACSIKRLPRVWKIISEPTLVMDESHERSLANTHAFKMQGDNRSIAEKLKTALKGQASEPVLTEVDGALHLFAQKNPYCRLGVYVTHLSIIFIFVGALIGSFFGYKAFVQIPEGVAADTVYTRTEKPIPLGFAVRCEKFTVSYYNTGAPKEFKSILTVMENGKPVPGYVNIPVIVNDPLTYKGITFYQSSYGQAEEGALHHLTVQPRGGGAPVKIMGRSGERIPLPGGGHLVVIEATQNVAQFMPQYSGPAAKVEVTLPGKQPETFIVFRDHPEVEQQRGGSQLFAYEGGDVKLYTGLQVAKDPGVWIVWLGCALMVVGIGMAFFMSHDRYWVRISGGHVVLGGSASKNPAGFQRKFEDLVEKIKTL